jgi:hypothetical protein
MLNLRVIKFHFQKETLIIYWIACGVDLRDNDNVQKNPYTKLQSSSLYHVKRMETNLLLSPYR